jgi:hypothetical protein
LCCPKFLNDKDTYYRATIKDTSSPQVTSSKKYFNTKLKFLNLTRNNHQGRNTGHGHNFNLPAHRTALFAKKPSYAGAMTFNALPTHLKQLEENKLKRGLRCWLMEESIYIIGEFLERANEQ